MKKQLLSLFFCIAIGLTFYANSISSKERRRELLQYVKKAPKAKNIDSLAEYLNSISKNEMEKAEVIFLWLSENIAYDVQSFQRGIYLSQDASTTLKNKKAVCGGYSNLYKAIATKMNLSTRIVRGYSKGYGYVKGKKFKRSGHAWNIVIVDGKEILVDATWGAGFVRDNLGKLRYFKKMNYYWFNTKPSEFVFSHLPAKKTIDQLLKKPLTLNEYEVLPQVRSPFFLKRIANSDKILKEFRQGVKHNFPKIFNTDVEVSVIKAPLEMKSKEKYLFHFYTLEGQKIGIVCNNKFIQVLEKDVNNSVRFVFSPAKRGRYRIGVQNLSSKKKKYNTIIEYKVN